MSVGPYEIDTRPEVVDIRHYAGDTLSIRVNAPSEFVAGREWSAQVRSDREVSQVDAVFDVAVDATGAVLTLTAEQTRTLASGGALVRMTRASVMRYTGEWDVQVSGPGGTDPVTSLAQGRLTIDLDVTRSA